MGHNYDPPDTETSVTTWLARLKAGDSQAGFALWQRYINRLVGLARRKLADAPRRMTDEEDVVLAAFDAFVRGVEQQRFSRLEDRHDLWQVLVMLTERKATGQRRHEQAAKRGKGHIRGGSAFMHPDNTDSPPARDPASPEPSPEFAVEFQDYLKTLLASLQDEQLRKIALARLEGYTNPEIAERLDLSLRGVERKLHLIRRKWEDLTP